MFNINDIRNDFPMILNNKDLVYFDNAATSFKPYPVINRVKDFYENYTTNIHRGDYDLSYKVSKEYDGVREVVKNFINASSENEIVFTTGATQSLNLVAYGYGMKHLKKDDTILTTLSEHASNILPWFKVSEITGSKIKYIPLNEDGTFNMNNYIKELDNPNVKIVSLPYVSNVLGYINPIKEICKLAHEKGIIVNVDGAQAAPHMRVDVKDLNVDFLSFSSHKMCGPDGVGVLYGKKSLLEDLDPILYGGDSNARFDKDGKIILNEVPHKFESGTPNIEGVLGFGEAIKYLDSVGIDNISTYEHNLSLYLLDKLSKLDNITIYNKKTDCGIVSFNVNGIFAQDVATYLNKHNICVRSGAHCAKILHNVIGTNETLRASLYFYNTKDEIDKFVDVLKDVTLEKCIGAII